MEKGFLSEGKNILITTDAWFFAPDGQQYKAVWGKCKIEIIEKGTGLNTLRSANWLVHIVEGDGKFTAAGCQVNYWIDCPNMPQKTEGTYCDKDTGNEMANNRIYFPDEYS